MTGGPGDVELGRFCGGCGTHLQNTDVFCFQCGAKTAATGTADPAANITVNYPVGQEPVVGASPLLQQLTCSKCAKEFGSQSALNQHCRDKHGDGPVSILMDTDGTVGAPGLCYAWCLSSLNSCVLAVCIFEFVGYTAIQVAIRALSDYGPWCQNVVQA